MLKSLRCPKWRYGIAPLSVIVALLLTLLFWSLLKPSFALLFYGAVLFSAWYGGWRVGLLANVLASLVINYFFIEPLYTISVINWSEAIRIAVFSLVSLLIIGLISRLRAAKQKAEVSLAKLKASEERYRYIVNTASEGIWLFNADLQAEYVNQQLAQMLGYRVEEILGRSLYDFMDSEAQMDAKRRIQRRKQGIKEQFDFRFRRKDGSDLWTIICATPILNEQNQFNGILAMVTDITERKHSEAAIRTSEALYRTLTEAMPQLVWSIFPDGSVDYINQRWQKYVGLNAEEINQAGWLSIIHPDDVQSSIAIWQKCMETGEGSEIELRCRRWDGSYKWFLSKSVPLKDEEGKILGWIGTNTDIEERKLAEIALRESEERFRSLSACSPVGIFMADTQGYCTYANSRCQEICGFSEKQALGDGFQNFIHPEDREQVVADWSLAAATGREHLYEYRFLHPEGEVRWVNVRTSPVFSKEGKLTGNVGTVEDITERQLAETALRETNAELQAIFEAFPDLLFRIAADGTMLDCKAESGQLYDPTKSFLGKPVQAVLPAPVGEQIYTAIQNTVATGSLCSLEYLLPLPQGIEHYEARIVPFQKEQVVAIVRNISDRVKAESERDSLFKLEQAARAEAEAANQIKDEFLAVLSHELRSPLNPILGWTKLLQTRNFDQKTINKGLDTIERNAKLQSKLIEDLLDISRIMQGKLNLNICPVNLVNIIEAAIETVRLAAETKSIQIHTIIPNTVDKVLGDPNRLQQVIWNLLSNAVKFTPAGGGVEIRLAVLNEAEGVGEWKSEEDKEDKGDKIQYWESYQSPNYVQIQVIDTGKGIEPEFLPYVFEYFRQADSSTTRMFGGLGLGLAIVRKIVELHGGTVKAESLGQNLGSTFTFTLAIYQKQDKNINQNNLINPSSLLPDSFLKGIKVLIVDDEIDTRELLVLVLQQYEAAVTAVPSADAALALIAKQKFDVLLSDIGMPEMDGYMLMRQVRTISEAVNKEIKAIALTAYAGETDHQQIMKAGFQKHLTKPVEPVELAHAIASLVKNH